MQNGVASLKRNLFQVVWTSSELKRGPIDSVEGARDGISATPSVVSTGVVGLLNANKAENVSNNVK